MRQLQKYAKAAAFDLPGMLLLTAGPFVFGMAVTLGICAAFLNREDGYGMIGGMLSLVGILLAVLVRHNLNPHTRLFLAVSMGETRRSFLFFDTLFAAAECLLLLLFSWCLCHVEIWVYRVLMPKTQNEFNVLEFFRPTYIAVFIAGILVLNLFWTAIMARFGVKGFIFIWLPIWLLSVSMGPAIHAAAAGEASLLGLMGRGIIWVIDICSFVPWQVMAGIPLLAVTAVSLLMLRRIPVRL